jgi:hypothetical protein
MISTTDTTMSRFTLLFFFFSFSGHSTINLNKWIGCLAAADKRLSLQHCAYSISHTLRLGPRIAEMTCWLTSGITISGIVVSRHITRPYKTCDFVNFSVANGINFVRVCIQFQPTTKSSNGAQWRGKRYCCSCQKQQLRNAPRMRRFRTRARSDTSSNVGVFQLFLATFHDRYCGLFRRPQGCSSQEDGQWTYNVTLRRIRSAIVAVEKQCVLHSLSVCICSPMYPACNAYAPYCHLWPAPLYNIFLHYLINGTIFGGKKVTEHEMCVFEFLCNFCLKHFSF